MPKFHIQEIAAQRANHQSFHIASETHVRIEFMRLDARQTLGPLHYQGDVVITCVKGAVSVSDDQLNLLEQCVVAEGEELQVVGRAPDSTIQLIWCPPFAQSSQVFSPTD